MKPVVDLGEGPGPPLIFRQNWEPPKGQKIFFGRPPPFLPKGLDDRRPPPPYLKLWIRYWEQTDVPLQNKKRSLKNAKAVFTL